MTAVPRSATLTGRLDRYKECERCGAGFDEQRYGGVGGWFNKIHCLSCQKITPVSFTQVIVPLVAEQYDSIESERRAEQILRGAQQAYEAEIARQSDF